MATAENKEVVRHLFASWAQGDLATFESLISPEFVNHNPNLPFVTNRLSLFEWAATMRATYPNFRVTVDDLLGEGEQVAARLTLRGRPAGGEHEPGGKAFLIYGMVICRVEAGQIVEAWWVLDVYSLFKQIGAPDLELVA